MLKKIVARCAVGFFLFFTAPVLYADTAANTTDSAPTDKIIGAPGVTDSSNTLDDEFYDDSEFSSEPINDPFESLNRHTFTMNETLDKNIIKPIATVYKNMLPSFVRTGVKNFFNNLGEMPTIANDLLQGQIRSAGLDLWRLTADSTVGIGGLIDVADRLDVPTHSQDFGLTLAKWGYRSSAYFIIPILGPSTVRDTIGLVPDYTVFSPYQFFPPRIRNPLYVLNAISQRAQLLNFQNVLDTAAVDPYLFQRDAYLQRRAYLIEEDDSVPEENNTHHGYNEPVAPNYVE